MAALALLLPAALLFETREVTWSGELVFALAWLVLVLSVGAISLLYYMIEHGAATRFASLFYLTPPATAVMGFALFGETLSLPALVGMAVAIAGVALASRKPGTIAPEA